MLYTYRKNITNMDGKYIYEMVNSQLNVKDRRVYLSTLTQEQKQLYTRYNDKVRQDRFKENETNKLKYNEIRKEYIKTQREQFPDKYKEQNIKDVRNFRQKEKIILKGIKDKENAVNILTDAIRARKSRKEVNILKELKSNDDINKQNLISKLTDAIRNKKARQEMKQLKTSKADENRPVIAKKLTKEERKKQTLAKKREYMRKYRAEQKLKKDKKK